MDEINSLLGKAQDAFDDATLLIEHHRNEAAANRLYYSVFYGIQALLVFKNEIPKTHKGIHIRFHELFIKPGIFEEEISQHVQMLSNLRQEGDYDLENVTDDTIQKAKISAEKVLKVVQAYIKGRD